MGYPRGMKKGWDIMSDESLLNRMREIRQAELDKDESWECSLCGAVNPLDQGQCECAVVDVP